MINKNNIKALKVDRSKDFCSFSVFVVFVEFVRFCRWQINERSCCINESTVNSSMLWKENPCPYRSFNSRIINFDFYIIKLDCCTRVRNSCFVLFNRKIVTVNELIFTVCYSIYVITRLIKAWLYPKILPLNCTATRSIIGLNQFHSQHDAAKFLWRGTGFAALDFTTIIQNIEIDKCETKHILYHLETPKIVKDIQIRNVEHFTKNGDISYQLLN